MSNPISALSFIYNEGEQLEECLSQLKPYVDEIILIDLESTDNTYEIAKSFTDKVYKRPFLLCGDQYKMELASRATNQWVLWFYPDERWAPKTLEMFSHLVKSDRWSAYTFMRHEYRGDVRLAFNNERGEKVFHGTAESPNYQNRLHRLGKGIFYTELVHAELHGRYETCGMPPEFYFEHRKTEKEQNIDNWRTYTWMKQLVLKYRHTPLEPYKTYIDSYCQIIRDSERLNLSGERLIHPAEEFWWNWWKHTESQRISAEAFKELYGITYKEFTEKYSII